MKTEKLHITPLQEAAALRACASVLHFHTKGFSVLKPIDAQMQRLALDCYIQGLLDASGDDLRPLLRELGED